MQELFKLPITKTYVENLLQGHVAIKSFLQQAFSNQSPDGVKSLNALKDAIVQYYVEDGGSPEIGDLDIYEAEIDTTAKTGRMRLTFKVNRWYGCSDISNSRNDKQQWDFNIDPESGSILFKGPQTFDRDPDTF